ncbi:hypothetical protein ILYODFUR_038379 [Ilyodon furcidens]|uniref:Transmembrane protein n=1 Tax=Ilyodon furcidens TaxID=33524 RepID=A0ABV0T3R0_9TELE
MFQVRFPFLIGHLDSALLCDLMGLMIVCLDLFLLFLVMKFISAPVLLVSVLSPVFWFLGFVYSLSCLSSCSRLSLFGSPGFQSPGLSTTVSCFPLITCPIVSGPSSFVFKFIFVLCSARCRHVSLGFVLVPDPVLLAF